MRNGESYAGTYQLRPLQNGWQMLTFRGKPVGSWRGAGGVYAAAKHFDL